MFPFVLASLLMSVVPISLAGSAAMRRDPIWKPNQYVPTAGMLLGNAISAIGVGTSTILVSPSIFVRVLLLPLFFVLTSFLVPRLRRFAERVHG